MYVWVIPSLAPLSMYVAFKAGAPVNAYVTPARAECVTSSVVNMGMLALTLITLVG